MITRTIFFLRFVLVAIQIFYEISQAKDYSFTRKMSSYRCWEFLSKVHNFEKKKEKQETWRFCSVLARKRKKDIVAG